MKKRMLYTLVLLLTIIGAYSCTNTRVYTVVEQMPEYPGGEAEMQRYIAENLKAPKTIEDPICTSTTVRFIIAKDGRIRNIEAIKNKDCALFDSLVKVIESMPRWIPGKHKGKTVDVYFTIPLHIRPK